MPPRYSATAAELMMGTSRMVFSTSAESGIRLPSFLPGVSHGHLFSSFGRNLSRGNRVHALECVC